MANLGKLAGFSSSKVFFKDYFKGFEGLAAFKRLFGERTEEVLFNLKVEFTWLGRYMWIDSADGHLVVNSRYLNRSNKVDLYLDLIHELVHVKQYMNGKDLFDERYEYIRRPTEIEAYRYTIEEARRIGLNDVRICQYLKTDWMSYEDLKELANQLEIKI